MSQPVLFTANDAAPCIGQLHSKKPLVHCLTNSVVQNFTANALLAIQASPAMVPAIEEIEEFSHAADALLVNVGTIEMPSARAMRLAAENACLINLPWVLDPVAFGLMSFRSDVVRSILQYKPSVIRGNPAEILLLAGKQASGRGTDSFSSSHDALPAATDLALQLTTIVAVTGEVDYITDGHTVYAVSGGHVHLTRVTGTGCSLSAIIAAHIASSPQKRLEATAAACWMMKQAGELAAAAPGLGSFASGLLDALSNMSETSL